MAEQQTTRGLQQTEAEPGDRQLLERFVARRDEVAFAGLVKRHSGMVWGVCKRMLRHQQDAEDAFQAVFLTLVRNAPSIRNTDTLGCWLYGVTCRIALKARQSSLRRQDRERQANAATPDQPPPWSEAAWRELQVILNEEVQRLPDKLRAPFILCCLEGMSKSEAGRELNWKEGTVSGRLAEARKLLQSRLARRGISLAAVLTALALAQQTAVAAPAVAASGAASPAALALVESAATSAVGVTVKIGLIAACVAALVTGVGLAAYEFTDHGEQPEPPAQKPEPVKIAPPPVAVVAQPIDPRLFVATFSPDSSKLLTTGGMRDLPGQIRIWSVPKGVELVKVPNVRGIRTAVFAPDGKTFLTGDFDGNITVRDAQDGKQLRYVKAHANGVNCIAFSPDGTSLLSTGLDSGVKLWDARNLTLTKSFTGHTAMVFSAAFFRDGKTFVTGSQDHTARVWDISTGTAKLTLRGHKGGIEQVIVAPDDKTIVTASWDRSIKLWNAETGDEIATLADNMGSVFAIAFTPDGKHLLSAGADNTIRLWNLEERKVVKIVGRHTATIWSLQFSPDQQYLASASFDHTAKLWDAKELKDLATLGTPKYKIAPVATFGAKKDKDAAQPIRPEPEPVVELLEDDIDFFLDNLTNPGANDASIASSLDRGVYSGKSALAVTPFQRFNVQMPKWNYKIAEMPKPGEYRYLRFAWKRTVAPGIMLQLHTNSRTWHRYYAGTLSDNVQGWGKMARIADEPPREWTLVTRDLFNDFGPMTITGIGFTALEGGGEACFDHMYLGRTVEDLDRVSARFAKQPEPVGVPEQQHDEPAPPSRNWMLPAALVAGLLVVVFAALLLVTVVRRSTTREKPKPPPTISCECKGCGKKLKVKAALAGKSIKCPECGKNVAVPKEPT